MKKLILLGLLIASCSNPTGDDEDIICQPFVRADIERIVDGEVVETYLGQQLPFMTFFGVFAQEGDTFTHENGWSYRIEDIDRGCE